MKTIIQKIQDKDDVIARSHKDDVDFISVFTCDDKDDDGYGKITVEFNEWGGPKIRNGQIVGDHDCTFAIDEMTAFVRTLGARLEFVYDGNDIEHHIKYGYRVVWDETIKGD